MVSALERPAIGDAGPASDVPTAAGALLGFASGAVGSVGCVGEGRGVG